MVDLPEPDSPTTPKISPFSSVKLTFWLAIIVSFLVLYEISKFFILRKLISFLILDLTRRASNLLTN